MLTAALTSHVSSTAVLRGPLLEMLALLPQPTEALPTPAGTDKEEGDNKPKVPSKLPENEMFVGLFVLLMLLDNKLTPQAVSCSLQLMERVGALKRRTLDNIAERVYFYASWAHECAGQLQVGLVGGDWSDVGVAAGVRAGVRVRAIGRGWVEDEGNWSRAVLAAVAPPGHTTNVQRSLPLACSRSSRSLACSRCALLAPLPLALSLARSLSLCLGHDGHPLACPPLACPARARRRSAHLYLPRTALHACITTRHAKRPCSTCC